MAKDTAEEREYDAAWGTDKADYYNADVIETEQDALEEEAEARRLQQKHLAGLSEADFGFDNLLDEDEDDQQSVAVDGEGISGAAGGVPLVQVTSDMSKAERLKLLHSFYPEFAHLRDEYLRLQPVLDELQASSSASKAARVRQMALSSYLGCLCMYFALLVSPASNGAPSTTQTAPASIMPPQKVRAHPLMARLVRCRELWARVEDSESLLDAADETPVVEIPAGDEQLAPAAIDVPPSTTDTRKRKRQSRAERAAEAAAQLAEEQRQARIRKTQAELADLSDLLVKPAKTPAQPTAAIKPADDDSDFGDEVALTAEEAADKARRKKSLRFYTSQIAQKTNKRERKGLMAGGDDDIPYRERFRDRQARTMDHPEDRYTSARPAADDGSEDDEVDNDLTTLKPVKRRRDGADAEAGGDGLGDAKRGINREIEKNKGLTPFRKKEVRNPRVKKRMRYEDKKKRLGSKKAIYKGGEGKGGYGGERTGINASVVKSIKL